MFAGVVVELCITDDGQVVNSFMEVVSQYLALFLY